ILTGQQAGLFGGPLYTLLKAITAIRLAARVSRDHGAPVVPVFWIDAEDHDWDEIAGCGVLDADDHLQRVKVSAPEGAGERRIAELRYTDDVSRALTDLQRHLPVTEFTTSLLESLAEDFAPARGVSDAFARWMSRTLGPHGLVVYDASDPATKPFAAALFREEL